MYIISAKRAVIVTCYVLLYTTAGI